MGVFSTNSLLKCKPIKTSEMLLNKNTEGTVKIGQSRETSNIWYTRQRKRKQNTICFVQRNTQTNTNDVNNT